MPKCKDCGNERDFIVTYIEFEKVTYQGNVVIDQEAGDRERADYWLEDSYKPECAKCDSTNIEGEL